MYKFLSFVPFGAFFASAALPKYDAIWQPAVGTKWQIEIWTQINLTQAVVPSDASVYDVDLFYTRPDQIAALKEQGKKVICYFSAGSGEEWRPDYDQIPKSDLGDPLDGWAGERYLNISSPAVVDVMYKRIQLGASKACDAIDPDNMDAYSNGGGGFNIQESDAIKYLQKLAAEARTYNMATGLKNAQEILPKVQSDIQFAVNEQCAEEDDPCQEYDDLLSAGKPVFHIEYVNVTASGAFINPSFPNVSNSEMVEILCVDDGSGGSGDISSKLSTVIKDLDLDGWVVFCDGKQFTTILNETYYTGDPKQGE